MRTYRASRSFRLLVGLASLLALSGCAPEVEDEALASREDHQFFSNSTRRNATRSESKLLVYLGGCAAFFADNDQGRTYLVTARHCVNYSINNWCQGGGRVIDNDNRSGSCVRVIAADRDHDIALFEVNLPYVPARGSVLRLAAYAPDVSTRLKMLGYPGDNDPETARRGRLTTTENCWIIQQHADSPYDNIRDHSSLHNCTTYGGNSGGPMYVEGTRDAVGLPFTYVPGDYDRRDPWDTSTAAVMAQMADFVARHRPALEAAGVIISESPPLR